MIRRKRIIKKSKNKYIEYKSNKSAIIWIICVAIIVFILSLLYMICVKNLVYQNVYQNITELSEQTATQLKLAINDQKNVVHIMAEYINKGYFTTEEEIFTSFREELGNYHFTRLVILDKKGNGITSDGFKVENYKNIDEFFKEECTHLSENRPSTVDNSQVNVYSHVFKLNGKERVLMANINTSEYKEILLRRLFGKGGTYLVNNSGTVLIDSFGNIEEDSANLYEYFKTKYDITNEKDLEKLKNMEEGIKNNNVGTFDITFDGEIHFVHYERLGINNWYVVTTASDSTIAYELIRLTLMCVILCLIIICVIVCNSIYIAVSARKEK